MDPGTFPVGTDPAQTWTSGYYPIVWTNRNYKMIYANFGHNAMNYTTNTRLSSTFESAQQDQLVINGLLWLGGQPTPASPPVSNPISATTWYSLVSRNSAKCVDARAAGSANGTAIQQYTCNGSNAQHFQFSPTSDGYVQIDTQLNPAQAIDVTNVSTANSAPLQLWHYSGGANQQWRAVAEGGGYYHFVSRNSNKCLDTPGASTADSVQLQQYDCNGTAAQSFRFAAVS